jgi:ABC-type lipoprotein release transport system permease subunit
MGRTIKMAWRNMWRNWRRTSIALAAIALGVLWLVTMDGLVKGSDQAIFGNAVKLYGGNVLIHAPGYREKASRQPLVPLADPDAVVAAARGQPNVVAAAKRITTGGMVTSRDATYPVQITGIEPAVEAPINLQAANVSQGRFLQPDDADAVFIGKGLADLLQASVGDRIVVLGRSKNESMRQRTMTVIGVYDLQLAEAERGMVFITLSEAQSLYNLRDEATEVSVSLKRVGQEPAVVAALTKALPDYEVDSWHTLKADLRQAMDSKMAFSSVFGLVVVFIACVGILNLMLMAVFERTREMGVLAALGLKGRQVMALFLLEGGFIGLVGALVGCALAVALLLALGRVGIDITFASGMGEGFALLGTRMYPVLSVTDLISRAITVMVIAALASLYPAWQASRKEPAQALHHV